MATAKKSSSKNNRKRAASGGGAQTKTAWIVLGLAVLAVVVVVVLANHWGRKQTTPTGHKAQTDARSVKKPDQQPAQKFEFYTLLPKQENGPRVPETPIQKPQGSGTSKPESSSPTASVKYWVQVGSFATPAEADRRKAEVAMLGFSSTVRSADVHGKTYYRVQIGPVTDKDVGGVEKRLHDAKINSLVTKAK